MYDRLRVSLYLSAGGPAAHSKRKGVQCSTNVGQGYLYQTVLLSTTITASQTMKYPLRIASIVLVMYPCIIQPGYAQVPAEPIWGMNCLWDEQDYLDTLSYNSYFPPAMTTVTITDVREHACRPEDLDSLDIYGGAIPFMVNGEVLETVTRKPMYKTIIRDLVFTNTVTGLVVQAEQRMLAIELLPHDPHPLTGAYVDLGIGTIDYPAIHAALAGGAGPDFHDGCGNDYTLSSFNVDGHPAIVDTYPWGTGSRVVLYWHCQNLTGTKWYIQHVFINGPAMQLSCTPPSSDMLDLSGCDQDVTPPTTSVLGDAYVYCSSAPVEYPTAYDDFDTAVQIQFLGQSGSPGCNSMVFNLFHVSDACGNSTSVSQAITVNNVPFLSFPGLPEDGEIAADAVLPDPANTTVTSTCGPGNFDNYEITYANNTVTVKVFASAFCNAFLIEEYTLTATSVGFFSDLQPYLEITAGEEPPAPVDLDAINTNNPFFYFTLTEDTIQSALPSECYTIRRTYRTYNGEDEAIETLTFVQHIEVTGDCSTAVDETDGSATILYPNPCNGLFTIGSRQIPARYDLFDGNGRLVNVGLITGTATQVDLRSVLVPGIYQFNVHTSGKAEHHRLSVINEP